MNYRTFTALLSCKTCGAKLPMQGPMRTIKCTSCQEVTEVDAERVADYLHYASLGAMQFEGEVTWQHREGHPCPQCGTRVDLGGFPLGLETTRHCTTCEAAITAFPPPAWLRKVTPKLEMVFGGERNLEDMPASGARAFAMRDPDEVREPIYWTIAFETPVLQRASDIADDELAVRAAALDRRRKESAAEAEASRSKKAKARSPSTPGSGRTLVLLLVLALVAGGAGAYYFLVASH